MSGSKDRLDPLMEGYLEYLADVSRKEPATVRDIRCTLRRVSQVMGQIAPDRPLWKLELLDYLRWLEGERQSGRGGRSLNKNVSHLRGFLEYAWRSGRSDRNVLDGFRIKDVGESVEPDSLSLEEAASVVKACPASTAVERRDRMIILLLYGCGLRTEELCALKVQDLDTTRKEVLVQHGKGDRQRIVPVPELVHTELLAYLRERGGNRGPLLRTTTHKKALSGTVIREVVHRAAERAGIMRKITPKVLRHSYATHLMDRGVDLAIIARLMGHRSPAETGVYLHVLKDRPRRAVERLPMEKGEEQ